MNAEQLRLWWIGWAKRMGRDLGARLADTIGLDPPEDDCIRDCIEKLIDVEQQLSTYDVQKCYGPSMNLRDTHCTNTIPCVHHGDRYPEPDSLAKHQARFKTESCMFCGLSEALGAVLREHLPRLSQLRYECTLKEVCDAHIKSRILLGP